MLIHALAALTLLAAPAPAVRSDTTVWTIDHNHSELSFRIRHMVSRVRGTFTRWEGTILAEPGQWDAGRVDVVIDASSIDTGNDRRDRDLRSDNFFDVEQYPTIEFHSTSVAVRGDSITVTGDLTMHGVTQPVTLRGVMLGMLSSPEGRDRVAFEAVTTLNRLDYGVTWNRAVEGGGVLLGDEVEIALVVGAVRETGSAAGS